MSDKRYALYGDDPRTRVLVISMDHSHQIKEIKRKIANIKWIGEAYQKFRSWKTLLKFHQITNVILDCSSQDQNDEIFEELLNAKMISKIENPKWKSFSSQPQKM